jgi:hypothetical protein
MSLQEESLFFTSTIIFHSNFERKKEVKIMKKIIILCEGV